MAITILQEENKTLIEGNKISEIMEYCLPHIRKISQEFYKKEIPNDLMKQGYSWIDRHAGQGVFYELKLIEA